MVNISLDFIPLQACLSWAIDSIQFCIFLQECKNNKIKADTPFSNPLFLLPVSLFHFFFLNINLSNAAFTQRKIIAFQLIPETFHAQV